MNQDSTQEKTEQSTNVDAASKTVDTASAFVDTVNTESKPPEDKPSKKSTKIETLSIRSDVADKNDFKTLVESYPDAKSAFTYLMDLHRNPKTPETKIIEKPIFKNVEVEKKLDENQFIVTLEPKNMELYNLIRKARLEKAIKTGEFSEMESHSDLFEKSFFNKSRLQNIDGEFYTGF